MRLLVIEDNQDIVKNICDYFDQAKYQVDCAYDGLTGLHLACTENFDVIILDLALPGMDGIKLCQHLRNEGKITTPIIMLTARQSVEERVLGLKAGADDYLIKPFSLAELEARIHALIRGRGEYTENKVLSVGDLNFDLSNFQVNRAGDTIVLTPVLLKILEKLMRDSPNVVTKSELEYHVWRDSPPDSDSLRAHMHTLRNAIDKPYEKKMLMTVHGIGYRLVDPA